jgi:hypothetical protein
VFLNAPDSNEAFVRTLDDEDSDDLVSPKVKLVGKIESMLAATGL